MATRDAGSPCSVLATGIRLEIEMMPFVEPPSRQPQREGGFDGGLLLRAKLFQDVANQRSGQPVPQL